MEIHENQWKTMQSYEKPMKINGNQ